MYCNGKKDTQVLFCLNSLTEGLRPYCVKIHGVDIANENNNSEARTKAKILHRKYRIIYNQPVGFASSTMTSLSMRLGKHAFSKPLWQVLLFLFTDPWDIQIRFI